MKGITIDNRKAIKAMAEYEGCEGYICSGEGTICIFYNYCLKGKGKNRAKGILKLQMIKEILK